MTSPSSSQLKPDEFAAYLRASGWRREEDGRAASVWTKSGVEDGTVLVPRLMGASDYEKRIALLSEQIARIELRDPRAVREDVARVFCDISELRLEGDGVEWDQNTVPLQAGSELYASAKKLVVAAAGATIRRQGHFGRSMPIRAKEHAKHVRLGQTRPGSYVVPVISDAGTIGASARAEHLDVEVETSLFERRVMVTLSRALGTLQELVSHPSAFPSQSDVVDAVGEGVSRELCIAVETVLQSDSATKDFSVSFRWAPAAGRPPLVGGSANFPRPAARAITHIAEVLRTAERPRENVLFGVVTHLEHHPGDLHGRIGIEALVGRRARTVWMDLPLAEYAIAVQCHEHGRRVVVRGQLRAPAGDRASMEVSDFAPETLLGEAPQSSA